MGPPVLFVHGLGSSGRDWEPQVAALEHRFRCVAPDLRGHGASPPGGEWTIAAHAADVAGLIEALRLAPAAVAGISLGGMIALELAAERPELVRRLAVINAPADLVLDSLRYRLELWARLAIPLVFGMGVTARLLAWRLFPGRGQGDLRREFVARWRENDPRVWAACLRGAAGWSVRERLPRIVAPTLVVAAEHDYFPPAEVRPWVEALPDGRLEVVEGARHAVTVERPETVNRLLAEFLG